MSELQTMAIRAVADAEAENPGSLKKIVAIRILRDADGKAHTLAEYATAVNEVLAPRPVTLTRADKVRAATEMSWRLMSAACEYDRHCSTPGADPYARTLRRRHAALLRIAMARTAD